MADLFQVVKDWWVEYYPIVVGFVTTAIGVIGAVLVIWNKVKPLIDKVSELKTTVETNASSLSPLEIISTNTAITDLKAKLENPTISDTLKLQYQEQLFALETLLGSATTIVDKVEDTTNTYL